MIFICFERNFHQSDSNIRLISLLKARFVSLLKFHNLFGFNRDIGRVLKSELGRVSIGFLHY